MERWEDIEWPPFLAILVSFALMLLVQFPTPNIPGIYKDATFAVASTSMVFALSWAAWHAKGRWNTCLTIILWLALSALCATLAVYGWEQVFADVYPPPKPVEMPRFIVRLVPEAITGKRMDFHISVQNLGADADITEYSFNVPGNFQSDDHNLSDRRPVARGDSISLPVRFPNDFLVAKSAIFQMRYDYGNGIVRNAQYRFTLTENISGRSSLARRRTILGLVISLVSRRSWWASS